MSDSGTQVLGSRDAEAPEARVQDVLKSALSKEVSAGPGDGGQFGDMAQFGEMAQFGDIAG
jgi:hypothetical protein